MSISGAASAAGDVYSDRAAVNASVKEYYGKVLQKSSDLKTSACTATGPPPATVKRALSHVPLVVKEKFYGCGNPIPDGIAGLTVLDLGCGSGRDCFVAAEFVGPAGRVIGLDMTAAQLDVAKAATSEFRGVVPAAGALEWRQGLIEDIIGAGVAKGTVHLVISNCVVNLSPDKPAVLQGAFDALAPGGEMYFSDVYVDRRLPASVRTHEVLFGECLSGALYDRDFVSLAQRIGFAPPRVVSSAPIDVHDESLRTILGNANFVSTTYRLFKLPAGMAEATEEDYGQVVTYEGSIPGHPHSYALDNEHVFEAHRPVVVSGNTAAMLSSPSWLGKFFRVIGDRSRHFGAFRGGAGATPSLPKPPVVNVEEGSGCCGDDGG